VNDGLWIRRKKTEGRLTTDGGVKKKKKGELLVF
jgi:hypothetical protein